jgi:ankyrin repeat protein
LDVDYSPTLLHLAAVKLKRGVVQAVLGLPRVIVDIEDENGQTPFCWVVTM